MTASPGARTRFNDLLEERRLELGLSLRDLAGAAGVSYEVIRSLRAGTGGDPRPLTMRRLDGALRWKPGSVERVLYHGGDPESLDSDASGRPDADGRPQLVRDRWDDPRVRVIWGVDAPEDGKLDLIRRMLGLPPEAAAGGLRDEA